MNIHSWRKKFGDKVTRPVIFPVIHVLNTEQAYSNIQSVQDKAIGGVFLINHDFDYKDFIPIIKSVRQRFPDMWIGVNFLAQRGDVAFPILAELEAEGCRVDAYWADDGCIDERTPHLQTKAAKIVEERRSSQWEGLYLGGVAFKKQRPVSADQHKLSASIATYFMDVVCTSGVKTGSAPDVEKIRTFRQGCGADKVLAMASGITAENVLDFLPYIDCILVSTGISTDFHTLSPPLLDKLIDVVSESKYNVQLCRSTSWYLSLVAPNTKGPTKSWLDPSAIYANGDAFKDLISDMTAPFPPTTYDIVVGIDGMGFPTAGAIAHKFHKGLVVLRKEGRLCVETTDVKYVDYSKASKGLEIRKDNPFKAGSRVLVVDQWVETGGTMAAAIDLVIRSGGVIAGFTAICIERNLPFVAELKNTYKWHEVVPEHVHHLFDTQAFRADTHSIMLAAP